MNERDDSAQRVDGYDIEIQTDEERDELDAIEQLNDARREAA